MIPLGDLVNSYIATTTCKSKGTCTGEVDIVTIGAIDYPADKVTVSLFWLNLGYIFALLVILSLLYPIANIIRSLVQEKETRIKESMMMMALRGVGVYVCVCYASI